MDRFQEMNVLLAIAQTESFAGGAKLLGLSPPSVTRVIAGLEARLGTLLLARSTRSLRLTEAGRRYVEDCKRILQELEEAEELATGSGVRALGNLTVTAPVIFGEQFLIPLISGYLTEHPEVSVNALLVDRLVNMADEGVDVALRIGRLPENSLQALEVGQIRPVICAAPAYLDQVGRPTEPRDLLTEQIVMSSASSLLTEWQFSGPDGDITLHPKPRLTVSSNQAAINAVSEGWGFTRVLSYQVAERVAKGELELVLEDFGTAPLPIHILYQGGRRVSAKVRTFVDYCASRFLANPALRPPAAD
ncbi:MAG: LysR family transcriptional regulator [Pseudomonas sp.]|uniref:LysR family transcriptional regulator n=1 Tax=Pseudomonas sp. TaxID=306 RepID=UPI003D1466D1